MNILLVNWQDIRNPQAGGAEIHLFEIFSRLAGRGHRVRLVCSGWEGGAATEMVQGIEVHRTGGRHSFALHARGAVRRALAERPDVVCEDINKLPLFLAGLTDAPFCAIIPHLFGTTAFEEAAWPTAATVWLAEKPIPAPTGAPASTRSARARGTTWWRAACRGNASGSSIRASIPYGINRTSRAAGRRTRRSCMLEG